MCNSKQTEGQQTQGVMGARHCTQTTHSLPDGNQLTDRLCHNYVPDQEIKTLLLLSL